MLKSIHQRKNIGNEKYGSQQQSYIRFSKEYPFGSLMRRPYEIRFKSNRKIIDVFFRNFNKFAWLIMMIVLFIYISSSEFYNVEAQTFNSTKTFYDPHSGITFKYPSDWLAGSQEYVDAIFNTHDDHTSLITPIVAIFHESGNGASLIIISEILPFPITVEKYFETVRQMFLTDPSINFGDQVPISINGLNGMKFNISYQFESYINGYNQTVILFVKDSIAFIVAYNTGYIQQLEYKKDIDFIVNSLNFESVYENTESDEKKNQSMMLPGRRFMNMSLPVL